MSAGKRRYAALYEELQAIASEELAGPLLRWDRWTPADANKLRQYLQAELQPSGMLSVDKAAEAGQSLGRERQQARRLLEAIGPAACTGCGRDFTVDEVEQAIETDDGRRYHARCWGRPQRPQPRHEHPDVTTASRKEIMDFYDEDFIADDAR